MGTSILLIWFDFYLGDSGELDAYDIIIEILWRLDGKASILFVGGFPVSLRHLKLLPDENFHDSQLPDQVTDWHLLLQLAMRLGKQMFLVTYKFAAAEIWKTFAQDNLCSYARAAVLLYIFRRMHLNWYLLTWLK